jgi:hypothetical protein
MPVKGKGLPGQKEKDFLPYRTAHRGKQAITVRYFSG